MHCWILENCSLTALPAEEFVGRSKVLRIFDVPRMVIYCVVTTLLGLSIKGF